MSDFAYLYQVVWTANSSIGRVIVLILLALTCSALACALSHRRRYRITELGMLHVVRARLQSALDTAATASTAPTASTAASTAAAASAGTAPGPAAAAARKGPTLVNIDDVAKDLTDATLVGDRVNTIARLRKSLVKVNIGALQQITNDRESARASLRFPEFAIGLLMLIGLFGTFVGIATTFQAVGADVSTAAVTGSTSGAGRGQMLEARVQTAFAGMRTKFSTSLVGLAGAILVSWMNLLLSRAQGRFLSELERFTVIELLPATIPAVEDELMLDRVARQLDEGLTRLEALATGNIKTMQDVAGIQAGFKTIVDNIATSTKSSGAERLQSVIGQLSSVIDQVTHVNQSVRDLTTSLPQALESSAGRIEKAVGSRPETDVVAATISSPVWSPNAVVKVTLLVGGVVYLLVLVLR
jgi:uncharacterized protein YoxC